MATSFKVRKAAQVSAYFAIAEGGTINVLKLVKLIYLSDRKFMEKYDCTILNDKFVSMDHGPVNSTTLDYINGCQEDRDNWGEFITHKENYYIGLTRPDITYDDLDELSNAEISVLDEIWRELGHLNQFQVRDYTHANCPEWEDPEGSSSAIPFERVFKFLKKKDSRALATRVEADRTIDRLFTAE